MGDRRLGEVWTPAQRRKNDAIFVSAYGALWMATRMPEAWRWRAGRLLGRGAATLLRGPRERAQERLVAAFGAHPPVTATTVFESLGEDVARTVALLRHEVPARALMPLSDAARAVIDAARKQGQGVVFATAHLGPIDLMAASVAEAGYPVATLARESYDPRFTSLYDQMRGPRGIQTIYRGRPGMEAAILRALRNGRLVGFPMDLAGRGMQTLDVPFLGETVPIPIGPARIARHLDAPVLVGTPEMGPLGMQVTVEPIARSPEAPGERAQTQAIAAALERRIRAMPAHWPWMHATSGHTRTEGDQGVASVPPGRKQPLPSGG